MDDGPAGRRRPCPNLSPSASTPDQAASVPELSPDEANVDKTLATATTEYEGGYVDMPLWDRALAQANGDREAAIPIYLRARATALQVLSRNLRASGPAIRAAAERKAKRAMAQDAREAAPARRRIGRFSARQLAIFGAAGAGVVGCGAVLLYVFVGRRCVTEVRRRLDGDQRCPVPCARKGEHGRRGSRRRERRPASSAPKQDLKAKVEELRGTGNFPLLVLFAVEWTRREPGNADAWSQLSMGYEALRQYDDAVDAATKAVKLAPGNSLYWRNLGQMNLYANRPEDALRAFDEAAALNDADIQSLVKAGILNVQLGRMPDASRSLDKALALSPGDSEAMCLKAMIAHKLAGAQGSGTRFAETGAARRHVPRSERAPGTDRGGGAPRSASRPSSRKKR